MLTIAILFICCLAAQAWLPEFDDPILGRLIVSRRNPPFLTPKAHPSLAYYVPTDQQVEHIRHAVFSEVNRFKRSSNDSSLNLMLPRFKRSLDDFDDSDDVHREISDDEFEKGMQIFDRYGKFVGRMVIGIFKDYLDKDPVSPSDLPFEDFNDFSYFKGTVVDENSMAEWLEDLRKSLEATLGERSYYLKIDKIISALQQCRIVDFTNNSEKLFQFKTDDDGEMTYYKVHCMRMQAKIFVFFAFNYVKFALKPEELERTSVRTVNERRCTPKFYTYKETIERKRHLTAVQAEELSSYFLEKMVRDVKIDYMSLIDAANEDQE